MDTIRDEVRIPSDKHEKCERELTELRNKKEEYEIEMKKMSKKIQ